jgi:hypothetical protein
MKLRTIVLVIACLLISWHFVLAFLSGFCLGHKCGSVPDFYPMWNASRALMRHVDPYGAEVTEQDQIMSYGATAKDVGMNNEQRFAYPLYATFPLFPLGVLRFETANQVALWLFAALTALSVGWLTGRWNMTTLLYGLLAFSSYPVILGLLLRQPTLLFFSFGIASFALLRSGYLIPAAFMAALSAGKPQIALAIVLPMLVWTLASWCERRRFIIWLAAFYLGLLGISIFLNPHWMSEWLSTLRAYTQYTREPVIISMFGHIVGSALGAVLFLGLVFGLWVHRRSELLFQMAASVAVIQLITPQALYTAIMLIIPVLWIAENGSVIAQQGAASQISLAGVRIALVGFWLANVAGAVLLHTSHMGQTIAWLLPIFVNRALVWTLAAVMIVQLFVRRSDADAAAGSYSVDALYPEPPGAMALTRE